MIIDTYSIPDFRNPHLIATPRGQEFYNETQK